MTDDSEDYQILSKGKVTDDYLTFLEFNNENPESFWNEFWINDKEEDIAGAKSLIYNELDKTYNPCTKSNFVPENTYYSGEGQFLDVNLDVLVNVTEVIKNLTEENKVLKMAIDYFKAATLKNYSFIKDKYVEQCNCCGVGHELADGNFYTGCSVFI